jgi:dihydroorotate dehydrogenase
MLARVYRLTRGRVPLIGIGGIDSGIAAIAKVEAGATLLQFYTGLVFEGPGLVARIKRALVDYAERARLTRIGEATGVRAEEWANRPLEA